MKARRIFLALIAAALLGCTAAEAKELTTVAYTVVAGDTMDSIAQSYLPSDRGNSTRAFAEFKEGIFEYNFDSVFYAREPYEVREGDQLRITLWR